jgi:replicative DNA helicase
VVDYLQLAQVGGDAARRNREQEVAHISRALKRLAKRLNVLVICAVQLNRGLESRADKRPMMSDLRDTGQLEQDADGILFLYRDVVYNDEAESPDMMELGIGKQRNGARGVTVFVHYRPGTGFVRDLTYSEAMGTA